MGRGGSVHIGASVVVYLLTSFLFFKGIWSKNYRLIALSLVIVFIYGSLVWGMFPIDQTMSWEGHLSGFLSGIGLAFYFKSYQLPKPVYSWQQKEYNEDNDEFMKHFDEEGNFVPTSELEINEEEENNKFEINYTIVSSKKQQQKP